MSLEGKTALITGGGTGVGRSTALELAARGVNVAINYSRSANEAEATAHDVEAAGVQAITVQADVSSEASVRAIVDQTADAFGRLDYLVNSAGHTVFVDQQDLDGLTEDAWDRIFAVNLKGAYFATRACAPHMRLAGAGAVVNISSVGGITGSASSIAYAASKGALNTLTKSLARALAPDIRVNAVAPGLILTRWVDGRDDFVKTAVDRTPLKRGATADDVAHTVLYLIGSTYTTGEIVVIDGGLLL